MCAPLFRDNQMAEPKVWLNGSFLPASQAGLAIYDAGIVLGATVTDLTRTFGGEPFRLQDHIARFYRSCRYARIVPSASSVETEEVITELIRHNREVYHGRDMAVVQFVTPGELQIYAGAAGDMSDLKPTYCIHTFPLPLHLWKCHYTEGAHVVTPSIRHIPPQCTDPKIKCRSRMHWWLADQESHQVDPSAISLCLDLDGNVTETSGSNFLIYANGQVLCPSPRNILRGISIETTAELCDEMNVPFVERDFQVYDVINAEEAWLASTPYCLAPVTRINGVPIGTGLPGPLLEQILKRWSQRVGLDIRQQIMDAEVA